MPTLEELMQDLNVDAIGGANGTAKDSATDMFDANEMARHQGLKDNKDDEVSVKLKDGKEIKGTKDEVLQQMQELLEGQENGDEPGVDLRKLEAMGLSDTASPVAPATSAPTGAADSKENIRKSISSEEYAELLIKDPVEATRRLNEVLYGSEDPLADIKQHLASQQATLQALESDAAQEFIDSTEDFPVDNNLVVNVMQRALARQPGPKTLGMMRRTWKQLKDSGAVKSRKVKKQQTEQQPRDNRRGIPPATDNTGSVADNSRTGPAGDKEEALKKFGKLIEKLPADQAYALSEATGGFGSIEQFMSSIEE